MKSDMKKYLVLIVRVGLGLVFLYAGILKISNPLAFAGSIAAYQILPYGLNYLVAAVLPWVEALCGLLLITGRCTRAAVCIVLAMNLVFIVALASTLVRGLDIDCGCFRQGGEKTSAWVAIMRDCLFLAAAVFLARQPEKVSVGKRLVA